MQRNNPLKKLAGETAIYGISTVLAKFVNFCLVPCYTRTLSPENYGSVVDIMAYVAIMQVILTCGLETGCFRFANKEGYDEKSVYSNALSVVFLVSFFTFSIILLFASDIANLMGYADGRKCIVYVGGILASDAVTSILFARLRQRHCAMKFSIFRSIKILTEVGTNLFLFLWYPIHCHSELRFFISSDVDYSYAVFSTFISCVVCFLIFIPDLFKFRISFNSKVLKPLLFYSIPLMIAGLPGIANDVVDRILFRWFDSSSESWRSTLGIYQAAMKLAIIMNLAIQMFRYAAEPFFFQNSKKSSSKELYAIVMEFFVSFCLVAFLGVTLFVDIISLVLGQNFRGAIGIVPIMLFSYILLGIQYNVSMWYKLSGETKYAILIASAGIVVSIIVNVCFLPLFSFWASAFGHFFSYLIMLLLSVYLGNKRNPFPYEWKRIILNVLSCITIYLFTICFIDKLSICQTLFDKTCVHCCVFGLYCIIIFKILKPKYHYISASFSSIQ